ncbi:fatty acyl-AMP ligase [Mycolicibacterium komossense]|uniref:AMP-binding protein n=1 Tax=Mycolicibacterium komossense TaxID=1779 RepID=A0ABT3CJF7_9MYCO|nr:fatty acyl-AMP ligase [Mycolicibacterium komossense]MCV7229366.1 AMP-binding protein [Mycolicibacterium komossense]
MGREALIATSSATAIAVSEYLDEAGDIALPDDATLTKYLNRNAATFGDTPAYRFLDYTHDRDGVAITLSWTELGARVRAVAGRLQQVTTPGDRVAVLAPQGLDYVVGFFAAIEAGTIAVPLFAPEMAGHIERLEAVVTDAQPTVILTTTPAAEEVRKIQRALKPVERARVIAVDAVPDSVGATFTPHAAHTDEIAYLQYTSGSTRTPAGVEISHRAVCTNVLQMVIAGGLDHDVRSVSWLPLYHDMGLMMVMIPALCGGQITLMSPLAFVRRPYRWIRQLANESVYGRTFAAAPNFAFDLAAERGLPPQGESLDLSNVAGLLNGSEPVTLGAIERFTKAFAPYGFPATAIKPSYGMAEATLSVATIAIDAAPSAIYLDRDELAQNRALLVDPTADCAVPQVSCGQAIINQWAVIADATDGAELADGQIGEIWLHGDNIGSGYWGREQETEVVFKNKLQTRLDHSHADGAPHNALWLRTGDLGVYVDDELYITGRSKDLIILDGRNHYPQDIEATVSAASPAVRSGYVTAFSVRADELPDAAPGDNGEKLIVIAERAAGASRDAQAGVASAVRAAVSRFHALPIADVLLVAAGTIPRTTSGKLARGAARERYLAGEFQRRVVL